VLLARDEDFVRAAVQALVQAALEAEMTEAIGAAKSERSETGCPTAAAITAAQ
jgi:transposase-like protein